MILKPDNGVVANWRSAVGSINDALAELQRACNILVEQMAENDRQSVAAAAAADRRVAEASASAEASIEHARVDARKELDEQRMLIEALQRDLQAERERHAQTQLALEAQRSAAAVPVVVVATEPLDGAASKPLVPVASEPPVESVRAALLEPAPAPAFDAAAYARQLLEHLESVYEADEASGIPPTELVERLVANLTYASAVFARRAESAGARDAEAFQKQLEITLDARGSVSFGRRLAIATFELPRPGQGERAHVA